MYLHIFFFDPVTIPLEKFGQLGICPLEEDHEDIETPKETEGWLARTNDPSEGAMTREWRLVPHTGVPVGTENTRIADGDHHHLLWVEKIVLSANNQIIVHYVAHEDDT